MFKYVGYAVVASLIAGIGVPVISNVVSGDNNSEATELVEATTRTNNKAESLNESFTEVIPPAPRTYEPEYALPANPDANTAPPPPPDYSGGYYQPGPPAPPGEGNPESDPYAEYEHEGDHAVRDALEYLNQLQLETQPTPNEYILAVEQLQRAWNPRYESALHEYKRLAYRIDHADAMAEEYFEKQQNLTSHISNAEDRARAENIDIAEQRIYQDWHNQAFKTLNQASLIMTELRDMNIIITKQNLSAHFAALYEEFQAIPPEITRLHEELSRFREESNRIQETFGVNPG